MRHGIVVLGFSLIILIMVAGCSSPQNSPTGTKNQNPAPEVKNHEMNFTEYIAPVFECKQQPIDPIRFQKFLPNIPGYKITQYGQKPGDDYLWKTRNIKSGDSENRLMERYHYTISDTLIIGAWVYFADLGPCAPSRDWLLNTWYEYGTKGYTTQNRINNFHGYQAVQSIVTKNRTPPGYVIGDTVVIYINDRLSVGIAIDSVEGLPLSEADAEIEKIANAIDFNGFAASV